MTKLAKIIRVITTAPFMALFLITSLYFMDKEKMGGLSVYIGLVIFLSVFPLLSYVIHFLIPPLRKQGRKKQRDMAFIMSILGYVCAVIFSFANGAPQTAVIISCTYLMSVILLTIFNAATKWKASGHACGAAGPAVSTSFFFGVISFQTIFALSMFAILFWASLKTKRHTCTELILGACNSAAAFGIVMLAMHILS